jgi:hypothetical protein
MVVSTSTSASRDRVKKNNIQVGGGYRIILASDDARLFIENVRTLQKTEGKKQSIKIDNAVDYGNATKHIDSALTILVNDISPEKKKLEALKQKFEKLAESTEFYVFEIPIKCKVTIDGKEIDGELIAIDDGAVAVAKTAKGNFMVTLESHLEIEKSSPELSSMSSQKSIFASSSGSSQRSSTKLESPVTESLSSTPATASNTDTSPYLATSEYGLTESETMNNNTKKGQTSEVKTTSDSSAKTSSVRSSDKTSSVRSSDKTSSVRSSDKTSSVRSSVSDENTKKSGMRGGRMDTKKIYKDTHNKSKFMKAGKSDSVGIIESVKGYYSESTSIEDGLCE